MPRKKKIMIEDDSHLPMKERIMRRLEKLIGYQFTVRNYYELEDKLYEVLDFCGEIEGSIEQTDLGDTLYLEMVCNDKLYSVLLPLGYFIEDVGEVDEEEDLHYLEEWTSG
jgi:hypothetical protein